MPMSPRGSRRRVARTALAATVALTIPGAVLAAEPESEGSLCDAISVEALDALGPLAYAEPEFGDPSFCYLEAAGDGSHSILIGTVEVGYDLLLEPDAVEYDVGGRRAFLSEGELVVDLGDDVLSIQPDLGDAPGTGDLDVVEYALDIAETIVAGLEIPVPADEIVEPDGPGFQPPPVEGIEWGRVDARTAAEFIEADEGQQELWQPLADALGVGAADVLVANVTASDAGSGDFLGAYSAIVVQGADADALRSAVIDWLRAASGEDGAIEGTTLGGKDVAEVSIDGEVQGYLYVAGDTAHAIPGPEDVATRILEALP